MSLTRAGGGASQLDRELSQLTTEAEHAAAQLGETRERLVTAEALTSELHFATQSAELVEEKFLPHPEANVLRTETRFFHMCVDAAWGTAKGGPGAEVKLKPTLPLKDTGAMHGRLATNWLHAKLATCRLAYRGPQSACAVRRDSPPLPLSTIFGHFAMGGYDIFDRGFASRRGVMCGGGAGRETNARGVKGARCCRDD